MLVGRLRRMLNAALALIIVLLLVFGGLYFGGYIGKKQPPIDSTTIADSFEDMAELTTQKYAFTDVGERTDEGRKLFGWHVPLSGKNFLITFSGTVTAGISDLSDVKVDIDDAKQEVSVKLPEPQVLDAHIDPSSVVVYDQSFNPFNPNSVEDVTSFLAEKTKHNRQSAIDKGLLDRAKEQASTLATTHVEAVLLNTDKKDYAIKVSFK
ncbi:DUF4230 domain-containing protein [Corynebacterium sp.]|uniref:DUF4230 domain-containing protein n=1 Tax=Corynebacterium sp. TaxID=1720 RepID=UPI0026DBD998|nr:DUF4230 domain-containing protein [Corynebacterium sp.]MDO5031925.1 DUF4230 domain-containing protein [Corynebacterium sp.]